MKIKRAILGPTAVAAVALVTGGWLLQRGTSAERNVYFQAQLFQDVLQHVSQRFVDPKDPSALYRMAIDGMLQELGDPHTAFMPPKDFEALRMQTQGEYGGLGIEIDVRNNWVTVISPLPGTPAERAGLQAGDRIVEVDGESTRGWTTEDAVGKLRGPRGSTVEIGIARPGVEQVIPFKVTRAEIQVKSVPAAYLMDGGVGYVQLRAFGETSTEEVRQAIAELQRQGMKSLVLDLRGNPGGLLEQGVAISDLFLRRGQMVVDTRSRVPGQNQQYVARSMDQYPDLPVAVLVSQFSASASEIVAGALQDHDRALVLGQTTFGKGSVQTVYPLAAGNYLKLTTARWYTPVGRSIQRPFDAEAPHALTRDGATTDTTELEEFRTDAGRVVFGGGGIRPDVVIGMDTLTAAERAFSQAVQAHGSAYLDAVYRYAIDYGRRNPSLQPGFPVTPAMLEGFYRMLQEAEIMVERTLFEGATRWVASQLAYQITYARWGNQEARKRANMEDTQVRVAADLLRRSPDPRSLFAAAERFIATQEVAARPGASR
jgi:carboxyl-terminal processing protease